MLMLKSFHDVNDDITVFGYDSNVLIVCWSFVQCYDSDPRRRLAVLFVFIIMHIISDGV